MRKTQTWIACGGVAAAMVALGVAADRARGGSRSLTLAGAGLALAYLTGTFRERSTIFGRVARTQTAEAVFALTFDDGPDPRFTPQISRTLAGRGHRATFFVLGQAVAAHPDVARHVLADGHELASHGHDHGLLAFARPSTVRRQLALMESALLVAAGTPPVRLFRAPHGVRSPWLIGTVRRAGYRLCAWDGAVFDTAQPQPETIALRVERLLAPGAVVLLHDGDGSFHGASRERTAAALPMILDAAERRGLTSVPLSELLQPRPRPARGSAHESARATDPRATASAAGHSSRRSA